MKLGAALGGAALAALVAVACADTPTDPAAQPEFDLGAMFGRASGAMPGEPTQAEYEYWDANGNGLVCVKTVSEGKGKGAQRTILKDDRDGTCPGGFEPFEYDAGGDETCADGENSFETGCTCAGDEDVALMPDGVCFLDVCQSFENVGSGCTCPVDYGAFLLGDGTCLLPE